MPCVVLCRVVRLQIRLQISISHVRVKNLLNIGSDRDKKAAARGFALRRSLERKDDPSLVNNVP
jgi:hypothetical protein